MKKTYIIPELEIVKVQTQKMLASSIVIDSSASSIDPSEADSREFPIWLLTE